MGTNKLNTRNACFILITQVIVLQYFV